MLRGGAWVAALALLCAIVLFSTPTSHASIVQVSQSIGANRARASWYPRGARGAVLLQTGEDDDGSGDEEDDDDSSDDRSNPNEDKDKEPDKIVSSGGTTIGHNKYGVRTIVMENTNTLHQTQPTGKKRNYAKEGEEARKQFRKEMREKEAAEAKEAAQERVEKKKKRVEDDSSAAKEAKEKKASEQAAKSNLLTLRSPWKVFGSGYQPPKAERFHSICVLSGLARGNAGHVATLDANCRPTEGRLIFTAIRGNVQSRVDVLADGRVYVVAGGRNGWLSLSGMWFAVQRHHNVQLVWNWKPYGHGYRMVTLNKKEGLCVLSGLIRNGRWGYFGRVGRGCWPSKRIIFSANNHAHITRVDVLKNGYFLRSGGYAYHGWVSLDGMAWSPKRGNTLALKGNWRNYGSAWRHGTYSRHGSACLVSGLVQNSRNWREPVAVLPPGCRPAGRLIFGGNVHMNSARVDVLPDGRIYYVSGKNRWSWLSLDGIKFIASS